MARLDGKVAIVTGGGRGIGRGVCHLLAAEGAQVVVNDPGVNTDGTGFDRGPAETVANEIREKGGIAVPNFDNVATMQAGENIIKTALDSFGRLDILICCAGILRDRMIFNMTEQEWDDVVAVHLKGHFTVIKPASVIFRQQRYGRIIGYSSSSGLTGNTGQTNYGGAKSGIAGLIRVVARDLGRYGVTANAISPGASTRMTATVPQQAGDLRARAGITGPGGAPAAQAPQAPQLREPEYVAPMTVYLCTDDAWNINGQVFAAAGGTISWLQNPQPIRTIFKPGLWTLDELSVVVPQLMAGIPNPAPPPDDLEVPGRPKPEA